MLRSHPRPPREATFHMHRGPDRLISALTLAFAALMLVLTGACSPRPAWSPEDIENSRHFLRSLEADQRAEELLRKSDPDAPQLGIDAINKYQPAALSEARLVQDSVLDKAHRELKEHFRAEYQKGLDSILASYGAGVSADYGAPSKEQLALQTTGVGLLKQWNDWLNAHRQEIRMPGQSGVD